jgi:hypothetical protein
VNGPKQPSVVADAEHPMFFFQEAVLSTRLGAPQAEQWRWITDPERLESFVSGQKFKIQIPAGNYCVNDILGS